MLCLHARHICLARFAKAHARATRAPCVIIPVRSDYGMVLMTPSWDVPPRHAKNSGVSSSPRIQARNDSVYHVLTGLQRLHPGLVVSASAPLLPTCNSVAGSSQSAVRVGQARSQPYSHAPPLRKAIRPLSTFSELPGQMSVLTDLPVPLPDDTTNHDEAGYAGRIARARRRLAAEAAAEEARLAALRPPPAEPLPVRRPPTREKVMRAQEAELGLSAEAYVELAFELKASGRIEERLRTAVASYDHRHRQAAAAVRKQLVAQMASPADSSIARTTAQLALSMRRNRFVEPKAIMEANVGSRAARTFRRHRQSFLPGCGWRIDDSCWKERKAEVGEFFETRELIDSLFQLDWHAAAQAHGLGRLIVANCREDTASALHGFDIHGDHTEVTAVRDALRLHGPLLYSAFDFYALQSSKRALETGTISRACFMQLVGRDQLFAGEPGLRDFYAAWDLVVSDPAREEGESDETDGRNVWPFHATRWQFMQLLVRCAIAYYAESGSAYSPSRAVNEFVTHHVLTTLPAIALPHANSFRKRFCYTEKVSLVLAAHLPSLRTLHAAYATSAHGVNLQSRHMGTLALMSMSGWLKFVEHVGWVEMGLTTVEGARTIFTLSRIRTCTSEGRLWHLSFCDFLEAIVRLSISCALPTNVEIDKAGAADAGEFMLAMQANEPRSYASFLETHRSRHRDPSGADIEKHQLQPVWCCIEHLIRLLVRTVKHGAGPPVVRQARTLNAPQADVQADEVERFGRARSAGAALDHREASLALKSVIFVSVLDTPETKQVCYVSALRLQQAVRSRGARRRVHKMMADAVLEAIAKAQARAAALEAQQKADEEAKNEEQL